MNISHESTHTCISKRGRPLKPFTQYLIAVTNQIITKYPHIDPRHLIQMLYAKSKIAITRNYAKTLLYRYRRKYNIKLPPDKTKYRNRLYRNNHNNNNNKLQRHFNHSQLPMDNVHDMILSFLYTKERQNERFIECINDLFPDGYKNHIIEPQHRYDGDYSLSIKDKRGRLRRFIQRLWNRETPISKNHIHYHNRKPKIIEYHIGNHKNHDLCKYLCTLLGIPFKSRIYLPHGRFFSTDCSGIDVSHLEVLRNLFYTNLETQLEGTALLEKSFYHGKLVVGNQVKHVW